MSVRLRRAPDVISAYLGDGAVVLSPTDRVPYALNETAAHVWRWLENGADVGSLGARLCETYAAPPERVLSDLGSLIEELRTRNLIAELPPDEPGGSR